MADQRKKSLMTTMKSASSSRKSDSTLSATLRFGSGEIFDFFCQSCSKDNVHLEAVCYCQSCQEYLCDTCSKYHRKTTATKHHKLLDKAHMPKNKMIAKPSDDLKETCSKHQGKLLEYFCNSHSALGCIVCINSDHRSCKVISYIPDVSYGIASSNEYNNLMTGMKALVSKVTRQQGVIKLSTKDNDTYHSESIAGIRELRKEFNEMLDKYEGKVSELHHKNSEMIKAVTLGCQRIVSDLTAMIAGLDATVQSGKNNQLFVDIKMSRQRLSIMEAEANDVTDCRITRYRFRQDEKLTEMMSTLSTVWSPSLGQNGEKTKVRYLNEVNVKTEDDTIDCNISGIATLPGGDIVVTEGKSLKLIDMKMNKVTSRISLSSVPQDITNTKPNQVAVSLGNEGKIEIYTLTDVISRRNTIHVGEREIGGICYTGEKFFLTYYKKGLVRIVDMSGRLLSTISTDQNGDRMFTWPRYIAIGREGDVAYVTDLEAHTVTTMTLSGRIISVYRNDMLKRPHGVTVGPDRKIYICSRETHTVFQLSATGEFQQVLLDNKLGLSECPGAIAYDDTRDRLYISSGSSMPDKRNYVKFFQIE